MSTNDERRRGERSDEPVQRVAQLWPPSVTARHNATRYACTVIRSVADGATERLWSRRRTKRFGPEVERAALRKLAMLDAAEVLEDLRVPPGNRLELLRATERRSTVFGSTSNGGSAPCGLRRARNTWRSWTITRRWHA